MSQASVISAAVAAAGARAAYALLRTRPPGGAHTWTRTNHRGEDVTLLEGPAVVAGGLVGAALAPAVSGRRKAAIIVAGAGAAAFGGYDDLAGDSASKGFRGHLGALRRGELTTGAVKLAGITATGFAAALLVPGRRPRGITDVIIDTGLIAGGANLLNLFDLRPGRAIKVAAGAGGLVAGSAGTKLAAAPLAAALALLPEDLGERAMLGDSGANGLGAMLGVAATTLPRPARLAALAGIAGLTAASERVSFSNVIERTGPLHWLDMLGRRPVAAGHGTAPQGEARPAAPTAPARAGKPR